MNYEFVDAILFTGKEGSAIIRAIIDGNNDTMWTTQKFMAEFFQKDVSTISKHLNNVFKSKELDKGEVTFNPNSANDRIIINPTSKKQPLLYNLDAIISVGYRVQSKQAIMFRRWANRILKEYMIKGFALDVEFLKNNSEVGIIDNNGLIGAV
jgi:hypothetical protein